MSNFYIALAVVVLVIVACYVIGRIVYAVMWAWLERERRKG
jgi:phage shock protein PspC (stress-responsive transcriptional regulator)